MNFINRYGGWLSSALFLFALVYFLLKVVLPSANTLTYGFAAYDTAARLVTQKQAGARLYDVEWFAARTVADTNGRARDIYNANPPTTALLFLPFVGFDIMTTRAIWTWLNVVILVSALALVARAIRLSLHSAIFVSALVLLSAPVAANFFYGQAYIFLLFLYALALSSFTRRAEITGASLGLALILKSSGVPLWLLLIARRNWRALAAGIMTIAAIAFLSVPLVGLDAWQTYLTLALPRLLNAPSSSVTAYQTVNSFFEHLFRYDAEWNPQPLFDAPVLARALTFGVTIAALTLSVWRSRAFDVAHAFAIFTILSVVLAPVAEEYHFVLMVIPVAVLIRDLTTQATISRIVLTTIAMLLLGIPLPYKDARLNEGAAALLAYPRFYGAWMAWGVLMFGKFPRRVVQNLTVKRAVLTASAE